MARYTRLRNHGAIPERQHDAFLLSLLLALVFSVGVFVLQALMPTIVFLMQLLGPEPAPPQPEPESMPFVLVDYDYPDEELDPEKAEAESNLTRQARQTEAAEDLPEDRPTVEEGVDEILTNQAGNPGLAAASAANESEEITPEPEPEIDASEAEPVPEPESDPSPPEPELPELPEVAEVEPVPEQLQFEPPPAPLPEEMPEPSPEPEPVAEPPPAPIPEPALEPEPPPEPDSEPEPEPEPIPGPLPEPEVEPEPEPPEPEPEPVAEMIDLAALPMSAEGFFDPETRRLEERARQVPEPPQRQVRPEEFYQPPQQVQQPVQPQQPQQPSEAAESGRPRRQPTFRRIGGASSAGGAPPRRNTGSAVRLIDADNNMAILAHRYGPYMKKVAAALQASLLRQIVLSPMAYSQGQVRIRFGISPDGTLTYYDTVFPVDGLDAERVLSERMLREAAPFDPLTPEMQRDDLFQKMSVIVTLY